MSLPSIGSPAPDFSLSDQDGKIHSLKDYAGKWVVLYFYPKDDTPGCTAEACSFRDSIAEYKQANVAVLGVSADDEASHGKFAEKFHLPFPLLADRKKETVNAYGVWIMKMLYGKQSMGIRRTSFLIDPKGSIAKVYENVKPEGHAAQILGDVQ